LNLSPVGFLIRPLRSIIIYNVPKSERYIFIESPLHAPYCALKGQTPSAVGTALGNEHTTKLAMAGQEHNIDFGSFLIIKDNIGNNAVADSQVSENGYVSESFKNRLVF
jgi:hypothetical protein